MVQAAQVHELLALGGAAEVQTVGEELRGYVDDQGRGLLHLACAAGNLDLAVALAEAGSPLTRRDRRGHTPLTVAAIHGQPRVVAALRSFVLSRLEPDCWRPEPCFGTLELVRDSLLAAAAEFTRKKDAVGLQTLKELDFVFSVEVCMDLMVIALAADATECVSWLIVEEPEVMLFNTTVAGAVPLKRSTSSCQQPSRTSLPAPLQTERPFQGMTVLHLCCKYDALNSLRVLLAQQCVRHHCLHSRDDLYRTPLLCASSHEIIDELVERDAGVLDVLVEGNKYLNGITSGVTQSCHQALSSAHRRALAEGERQRQQRSRASPARGRRFSGVRRNSDASFRRPRRLISSSRLFRLVREPPSLNDWLRLNAMYKSHLVSNRRLMQHAAQHLLTERKIEI